MLLTATKVNNMSQSIHLSMLIWAPKKQNVSLPDSYICRLACLFVSACHAFHWEGFGVGQATNKNTVFGSNQDLELHDTGTLSLTPGVSSPLSTLKPTLDPGPSPLSMLKPTESTGPFLLYRVLVKTAPGSKWPQPKWPLTASNDLYPKRLLTETAPNQNGLKLKWGGRSGHGKKPKRPLTWTASHLLGQEI